MGTQTSRCSSLILLFVVYCLTITTAQAQSVLDDGATNLVRVPLSAEPLKLSRLVIPIQINGGNVLPFLVDTGVSLPIIVDQWAADQLGIKPSGRKVALSDGSLPLAETELKSVTIKADQNSPDLEIASTAGYIGDLQLFPKLCDSVRLAGAIGMPLLNRFTTTIDFDSDCLLLSVGPRAPNIPSNAVVLSLLDAPTGGSLYQVRWDVSGSKSTLLLDTGSPFTLLPQGAIAKLPVVAEFSTDNITTLRGTYHADARFVSRFAIGERAEPNVMVYAATADLEPTLGLDLLSRFRVTVDGPRRQLILEPRTGLANHLQGFTGITKVSASGKYSESDNLWHLTYVVDAVMRDSPAYMAGVQPGSRLLQANGSVLSSLPPAAVKQTLTCCPGNQVQLLLASATGRKYEASFQCISDISPNAYLRPGFRLVFSDKGGRTFGVSAILCDSPSWRAGVRSGDILLAIDGTCIQPLNLPQVEAMLQKTSERLTLRHLNQTRTVTLSTLPPLPTGLSAARR